MIERNRQPGLWKTAQLCLLGVVAVAFLLLWAACCPAAEPDPLLRWGTPDNDYQILIPGHLLLAFDGRSRQARYVLARWTPQSIGGAAPRPDNFYVDRGVPREFRPSESDYHALGPLFDIGHFEQAQNGARYPSWMRQLFSLSNCGIQDKTLNEGPWRADIELPIHRQISEMSETWILTAAGFVPDEDGKLTIEAAGRVGVWKATHYTKATLAVAHDQAYPKKLTAWCVPNQTPPDDFDAADYLVSVDELEFRLGLNLWDKLPEPMQSELEAAK